MENSKMQNFIPYLCLLYLPCFPVKSDCWSHTHTYTYILLCPPFDDFPPVIYVEKEVIKKEVLTAGDAEFQQIIIIIFTRLQSKAVGSTRP